MSKYGILLFVSAVVPFVFSFWPALKFYKNLKSLVLSIVLIVLIFGGWDCFAAWRGHWYFNPTGVGRITVINLPLEEVLFFVAITFCCIFSWEAFAFLRKKGL